MSSSAMRTLLLPLLLALCGCPSETPVDEPPAVEYPDTLSWPVDEVGPFQVGHFSVETTYTMPSTGESRTIPVSVWYPTEDTTGAPVEHYASIVGDSFERALAAEPVHEGGYPVLAYSHGNIFYPAGSKWLMRRMASHGWVAVAPAHLGNTLITAGQNDPRPVHLWLDRSSDISAALDLLGEDRPELAGPVNLSRVVMSGHSFGGHTTWATAGGAFDVTAIEPRCDDSSFVPDTCGPGVLAAFEDGGGDARVVGAIAMDGAGTEDWFGPTGLGAIEVPMMQMYTDSDSGRIVPPSRAPGVDLRDVLIEGACHGTFSVASSCATLDADLGYAIVETYALAFARHVALGDETERTLAILEGDEVVSDRVTLLRAP